MRTALRREGRHVNNKRVQRLWRDEGLRVPYRKRKKLLRRLGTAVGAMSLIAPNALWALDFQFDTTDDNRTIKLLNVIDEFTRECPAIVVERSIDADRVVAHLRSPGRRTRTRPSCASTTAPEFIAYAVADWCRFNGVGAVFIDPGSPWQNASIEIVQRAAARRAAQRMALRPPARGQGAHRGLAHRLQREPTTLGPR